MLRTALTALLFILYCEFVAAQLTWTNTLSDVLTNQGVPDNTTVGTELGTISVSGSQGATRYYSNSSVIAVDQSTGVVTLQRPLDYATMSSFVVQFTAVDSTNANTSTAVMVNVLSSGNQAPEFNNNQYTTSVSQSEPLGSTVYREIFVTDSDDGPAGDVTVSCQNPPGTTTDACAKFRVDVDRITTTADRYRVSIILIGSVHYSNQSVYRIILRAEDGGNPALSSSATLTISILDPRNYRPTFLNAPISFFVREREPTTTVLTNVLATIESNPNNPLVMEITHDKLGFFSIGSTNRSNQNLRFFEASIRSNGNITRAHVLNVYGGRQYTFVVTAYAIHAGIRTTVSNWTNVTAIIQDPNNSPPQFQLSTSTAVVSEGIERGSLVPGLNMVITDPDRSDSAFFRLSVTSEPSPAPDIFGTIPLSGQSQISASLIVSKPEYLSFVDAARRVYTVTVRATNNKTVEKLFGEAQVTINVIANNNPPYFEQRSYLSTVRDDRSVGSLITTVHATDLDHDLYGRITYSILASNDSYISIDSRTGEIHLVRPLGDVKGQTLEYVLMAKDGANATATAVLTVNVLDSDAQGPRFNLDQYTASVPELKTDLLPGIKVYATPLRQDRVLSYWIVDGNYNNLFELDPNSGKLIMRFGVDINDTPDRQGFFDLIVEARESGRDPINSNVTVRINVRDTNNHVPEFTNTTYSVNIPETSPPGTTVIRVNATDLDIQQNALITYIIGPGGQDNFGIDPNDGNVFVSVNSHLVVDHPPTYYNVTVFAVDHGSPQLTGTTTVYVLVEGSERPVFNSYDYRFSVWENATLNHSVGVVMARLAGTNRDQRAIMYTVLPDSIRAENKFGQPVTMASPPYDYKKMFDVDPWTGTVVVSGRLSRDYATISYFQIQANNTQASYQVHKTDISNVTVYIRALPDPPIHFVPPLGGNRTIVIYLKEERPNGYFVFKPVVRDVDNSMAVFRFQLNCTDNQYLTIDPSQGIVTVSGRIDYETFSDPKEIRCTLVVSEPHVDNRSISATLVVRIEDINDNSPVFSQTRYNFWVYDNAEVGYVVGDVNATDGDSGQFGLIQYAFISDVNNYFFIEPTTGMISVNKPLDQLRTLTWTVTATDNWNGTTDIKRVAYVPVVITVLDSDTSGIVFLGAPYSFYTVDSVPVNYTVGAVAAIDLQTNSVENITYRIVSNNDSFLFSIDSRTGEITTAELLTGYSRPNSYLVNVSAEADSPPRVNFTLVAILIRRLSPNDTRPFFIRPDRDGKEFSFVQFEYDVFITDVVGKHVERANVTRVSYYFLVNNVPVSVSGRYKIDTITGRVTFDGTGLTSNSFNRTFLTLVLIDNGVPPQRSDPPRIMIVVVNDPSFERCPGYVSPQPISVPEDAAVGHIVAKVQACNPDSESPIYYYLIDGNATTDKGGPLFILRPDETGRGATVFTHSTLDVSLIGLYYQMSVIASNSPINVTQIANWTGTRLDYDVFIVDIDNSGPTFDSELPGRCAGIGKTVERGVLDFPVQGELLVTMFAGDCDLVEDNRQVTYSLRDIKFEFLDSGRGYKLDGRAKDLVDVAFSINSSGTVTPRLNSYRPYTFGRFVLTVVANDSKQRTDSSELRLYIVQESDQLRYTFNTRPVYVQPSSEDFLKYLDEEATKAAGSDSVIVVGSGVHYHIDGNKTSSFTYREFANRPYLDRSYSDLSFYAIKNGKVVTAKTIGDLFDAVNTTYCTTQESSCPIGPVLRRYPPLTTRKWSGHWWLWWLLIALAMLIFLLALILSIVLCCLGLSYQRRHMSQMYFALDEPRAGAVPVSEYEYQEASHQLS